MKFFINCFIEYFLMNKILNRENNEDYSVELAGHVLPNKTFFFIELIDLLLKLDGIPSKFERNLLMTTA